MSEDLDELVMGETSRAAAELLEQQGYRVVPRALGNEVPQLPRNVTDLHEEDLMEKWTATTSWLNYLEVQLAAAQIDESDLKRKAEIAGALALLSEDNEGKKESVTAAKARRIADPANVALGEKLSDAYAYRKMLEVMVSGLERNAALLSRELTRRTAGPTQTARAGRTHR